MNCTPLGKTILALIASSSPLTESSIKDNFTKRGFRFSTDAIGNEVRRLRMAGAVRSEQQFISLTSDLLMLHIREFGSFDKSLEAFFPDIMLSTIPASIHNEVAISSASLAGTHPTLFYSYSHKDESLRDQLNTHLVLLERQEVIAAWYDRQIPTGAEWSGEIDRQLESASIILLLISADFLASNYCYDIEMRRAMEMHTSAKATVIPIILRDCDWHSAPFGKLQALPTDGKPITSWPNVDEAFTNVAKGVRSAAEGYLRQRNNRLVTE
jgi:hypothetical protein